jgi:hypothetical protein
MSYPPDRDAARQRDDERNAAAIRGQLAEDDERQRKFIERGERATGHSIHDDPGPDGDYYEGD